MNTRFIATGLFWFISLIACTRDQQPLQLETPLDIVSQQAQVADDYPYEWDVCSSDEQHFE